MIKHTSAAAPSLCVAKAIRQYFQTGALPDLGVLCDADMKPLVGNSTLSAKGLSDGDKELMQAMMGEVNRLRRGVV